MNRENRYLVIKLADLDTYLPDMEHNHLISIAESVRTRRVLDGRHDTQYVCVADDWPMYEQVWRLVENWVDGDSSPEQDRAAVWSVTPPSEQADWWWWNGDSDTRPVLVSVLYSVTNLKCFATAGQHGWNTPQYVDEMGGWWMKAIIPNPPVEGVADSTLSSET